MDSQKTNLECVKSVAHTLLNVEIQVIKLLPVVVSHPFTNSWIAVTRDERGDFVPLNLLDDSADLAQWRKEVAEQIDKSKSAYQIFMLINSPYYLTFIKYASPYLSEKDLGRLLSDAWIMTEFPNADKNVSRKEMLDLFKSVSPQCLMDKKELQLYQSLGDTVTVYRGVGSENKDNVKALSWTLDRMTAEWFAHRFEKEGTVYAAQIKKEFIHAVFNGRNESEVIVDPSHLDEITVVPKQQEHMTMEIK